MKLYTLLLSAAVFVLSATTETRAQDTFVDQCNLKCMTKVGDSLYLGTSDGILIFDINIGETMGHLCEGENISAIAAKSADDIWATYDNKSVNHYDGKAWTSHTAASGAFLYDYFHRCYAFDEDGNVWTGGWNELCKFDGNSWTRYGSSVTTSTPRIDCLAYEEGGILWVAGTDNSGVTVFGEFDFANNVITPVTVPTGFNNVNSLVLDQQGNKWLGTSYYGIACYNDKTFTVYDKSTSEIPSNSTVGLTVNASGTVFFGVGKYLYSYNGVGFRQVGDIGATYPREEIKCIMADGDNLWVGSSQSGLHYYDFASEHLIPVTDGTTVSGIASAKTNDCTDDADDATYDLTGRRISNPAKGTLCIKAGKKYIVR